MSAIPGASGPQPGNIEEALTQNPNFPSLHIDKGWCMQLSDKALEHLHNLSRLDFPEQTEEAATTFKKAQNVANTVLPPPAHAEEDPASKRQ